MMFGSSQRREEPRQEAGARLVDLGAGGVELEALRARSSSRRSCRAAPAASARSCRSRSSSAPRRRSGSSDLRTALSAHATLRPWLFASPRSDAAASLTIFRRRSLPMFAPLRVDRRRGADVRLRRHREHVGRLGDPDAGRRGARAVRRDVDDHRDPPRLSCELLLDDLPHRVLEPARRVEHDHGRVVVVLVRPVELVFSQSA